MRALVLGSTGFIGGHIAIAALEAGWFVRALRRDPQRTGMLTDLPVEWVTGDLDAPEGLASTFSDINVVFHAAGYYPLDSKNVPAQVAHSMQQTANVVDLVRKSRVKRLVYTSSYTTMVPPISKADTLADESDYYQPGMLARSAYYECKFAMEHLLLNTHHKGLDVVILNPTLVLGPGGDSRGTGAMFMAMARGWVRVWLPAKINAVDVRDVAQAHFNAVGRGTSGERYLLGGHNLMLRQLIEMVAQMAGVRKPGVKLPLFLIDLLVWMEDHIPGVNSYANHLRAIRHWPYFTNARARRKLEIEFRPLEDTISEALASYKLRGYL